MSERRPPAPGGPPAPEGGSATDIGRLWRTATSAQRIGIGAFLLICVGSIALVASTARRPQYGVVYANLDQEDAAEVVQRLRDLKVPYRVTAAGTVECAADRIHELRLDLAAEGLPAGGQSGFELFDRTRLGISEFGEKLNYQRALQGELARTIAHLDSVEQARVHLALPRERLYTSEQQDPTASVVLKLRGGRRVTPPQIRSIVHLVSGAVEGLSPASVALLDTGGRLLASPDDSGAGGAGLAVASTHLQLRREYEHEVEQAVQSMLDSVVGPGKSVVRASALLSFDSIERESETYQPTAEGDGVVESRRETKETYRGLGEAFTAGVPGVTSNTSVTPPPTAQGQSPADHYDHTETTSLYRVSRQREHVIKPPGQLEQLSLSVFIDAEAELGEVEDLQSAVSAAAGLDPERGDAVVITRVPFQPPAEEEGGSRAFAIRDFYYQIGRDLAAIVLMVLFLRFVLALLRRRAEAGPLAVAAAPAAGPQVAAAPAAGPQVAAYPVTAAGPNAPAVGAAAGGPAAPAAGAGAPPQVSVDPERAAAVLKTWLSEDNASGGQASPGGDGHTSTDH